MTKLLVSKCLLPITRDPIKNGCLVLNGDIILSMGSYHDLKHDYPEALIEDHSDEIILPGFVNCHTHLDLTALGSLKSHSYSFTKWIKELIKLKSSLPEPEIISGIQNGINTLWDSGVVAVGDISSDYKSFNYLSNTSMTGRVYYEYLSLKPEDILPRFENLKKSIESLISPSNHPIDIGISPHSTYTLHPNAFETIFQYIRNNHYHSTIHVGESIDEMRFFSDRIGELFEFINSIFPVDKSITNTTPLTYLYNNSFLDHDMMIIHLNILDKKEIKILKDLNLSVVHCPRSHDYFNHPPFQLEMLLNEQINIAIGTDSIASNEDLNFFRELQRMYTKYPFLTYDKIIHMATISGSHAMKLRNGLGEISLGKPYHLIAVKINENISNPYENIIFNNRPVSHIFSSHFN